MTRQPPNGPSPGDRSRRKVQVLLMMFESKKFRGVMFARACRMLRHKHDAEDSVADTFKALVPYVQGRLPINESPRQLAFATLRNVLRKYIGETEKRRIGFPPNKVGPSNIELDDLDKITQDEIDALCALCDQLPPRERNVVRDHYVHRLKIWEIARMQRVPENTIKSDLSRARMQLREMIEPSPPSEPSPSPTIKRVHPAKGAQL